MAEVSFNLSRPSVDFGRIAPGATEWRSITVLGLIDGDVDFELTTSEPWVEAVLGSATARGRELMLAVDATQLPGFGQHQAIVRVTSGRFARECQVSVWMGTVQEQVRSKRAPLPSPAKEPSGVSEEQTSRPALTLPSALPIAGAVSLGLGILTLVCVLGGFRWAATAMWGAESETGATLAWLAASAVYLIVALRWALPGSGRLVTEATATPQEREVLDPLAEACREMNLPRPALVMIDDPAPNIRSFGISPRFSRLRVNTGLADAMRQSGSPSALKAVLVHELVHLQLFDTFFFTVSGPVLAALEAMLGLAWRLRVAAGQMTQGSGVGPIAMFVMMSRGSPMGCLVGLLVLLALAMLLSMVAFYAVALTLWLLLVVAACLGYSRFVERRADLRTVDVLGDSQGVLAALAASLALFPGELAAVGRYARSRFTQNEQYSIDDLIASLASGGDPKAGTLWAERLFRTHPPFMERLAYIAMAGSQRSAN
ncbi:MAG TPA: M48 family metalloprotease [Phycisphaerae bacterium]|nr:M48 family metalloprotease [Phycisphaerae bacterium]HRY67358.1 M48 family metalloprotease [Phycisphaerae bacterium]HSA29427.1 M48 family metalloprotease [Phycisphaerae bacterium]